MARAYHPNVGCPNRDTSLSPASSDCRASSGSGCPNPSAGPSSRSPRWWLSGPPWRSRSSRRASGRERRRNGAPTRPRRRAPSADCVPTRRLIAAGPRGRRGRRWARGRRRSPPRSSGRSPRTRAHGSAPARCPGRASSRPSAAPTPRRWPTFSRSRAGPAAPCWTAWPRPPSARGPGRPLRRGIRVPGRRQLAPRDVHLVQGQPASRRDVRRRAARRGAALAGMRGPGALGVDHHGHLEPPRAARARDRRGQRHRARDGAAGRPPRRRPGDLRRQRGRAGRRPRPAPATSDAR